jgi:hypothetical protein
MTLESQRACPFCAERISTAAKLCPRCRQWLNMRSFRHPLISSLVIGLPVVALVASMTFVIVNTFEQIGNPRPHYTELVGSLKIVESRMDWMETRSGLRIYITGILTNQSQHAWKDLEFECRFFDKGGVMADASSAHSSVTILPMDDSAFRAMISPGRSTNHYVSFKISVSNARNAKAWF